MSEVCVTDSHAPARRRGTRLPRSLRGRRRLVGSLVSRDGHGDVSGWACSETFSVWRVSLMDHKIESADDFGNYIFRLME